MARPQENPPEVVEVPTLDNVPSLQGDTLLDPPVDQGDSGLGPGITQLSSRTSETGDVNLSPAGAVRAGANTFCDPGIFLGRDGSYYKFSIVDETKLNFMKFDGTELDISGNVANQIAVTAGEAITLGDVVCTRGPELQVLTATDDALVLEGTPDTNYGTATTASIGANDATDTDKGYFFVKFDTSSIIIDDTDRKAYLILAVSSSPDTPANLHEIQVQLVTGADWSESTITWNNQPAFSGTITDAWEFNDSQLLTFSPEIIDRQGTDLYLDVTSILSTMESTNYGMVVRYVTRATSSENTTSQERVSLYTSETALSTRKPNLAIMGTASSNAGKAFLADNTDLQNSVGTIGVAKNTAALGASVTIQTSGTVTGVSAASSGESTLTKGRTYFLSNHVGEVSSDAAGSTIIFRRVGKATGDDTMLLDIGKVSYKLEAAWTTADSAASHDSVNFIPMIHLFRPTTIDVIGTLESGSTEFLAFNGKMTSFQDGSTTNVVSASTFTDQVEYQDGQTMANFSSGNVAFDIDLSENRDTDTLIKFDQADTDGASSLTTKTNITFYFEE